MDIYSILNWDWKNFASDFQQVYEGASEGVAPPDYSGGLSLVGMDRPSESAQHAAAYGLAAIGAPVNNYYRRYTNDAPFKHYNSIRDVGWRPARDKRVQSARESGFRRWQEPFGLINHKPSAITPRDGFNIDKVNMNKYGRKKGTGRGGPVVGRGGMRKGTVSRGRSKSVGRQSSRVQPPRSKSAPARGRSYSRNPMVRSGNSNRAPKGSRKGFSGGQRPLPLTYSRTYRLGSRVVPRNIGNNIVSVPIKVYDDQITALYPEADAPTNFIAIGSSIIDCCNDYQLAAWSEFYNPGILRTTCMNYAEFKFANWQLEYRPFVNPNASAGEIIFGFVQDTSKLVNKGLTFTCSSDVGMIRMGAGLKIVLTDYTGASGLNAWGDGASHVNMVKNGTFMNPKQIAPYQPFIYRNVRPSTKWMRNSVPAGGNSLYPWDYSAIDTTEAKLCNSGCFCVWGTMNDQFVAGPGATTFVPDKRKIGDIFLNATVHVRGLGDPDIETDTVSRPLPPIMNNMLRNPLFVQKLMLALHGMDFKHPDLKDTPTITAVDPADGELVEVEPVSAPAEIEAKKSSLAVSRMPTISLGKQLQQPGLNIPVKPIHSMGKHIQFEELMKFKQLPTNKPPSSVSARSE